MSVSYNPVRQRLPVVSACMVDSATLPAAARFMPRLPRAHFHLPLYTHRATPYRVATPHSAPLPGFSSTLPSLHCCFTAACAACTGSAPVAPRRARRTRTALHAHAPRGAPRFVGAAHTRLPLRRAVAQHAAALILRRATTALPARLPATAFLLPSTTCSALPRAHAWLPHAPVLPLIWHARSKLPLGVRITTTSATATAYPTQRRCGSCHHLRAHNLPRIAARWR